MDTEILSCILDEFVKCPICEFNIKTDHVVNKKQGLSHLFKMSCKSISCRWSKSFYSSKEVMKSGYEL